MLRFPPQYWQYNWFTSHSISFTPRFEKDLRSFNDYDKDFNVSSISCLIWSLAVFRLKRFDGKFFLESFQLAWNGDEWWWSFLELLVIVGSLELVCRKYRLKMTLEAIKRHPLEVEKRHPLEGKNQHLRCQWMKVFQVSFDAELFLLKAIELQCYRAYL